MRILFVHNNYASNNSGEEHASAALAKLLEDNGHTIDWFRKSSDVLYDNPSKKITAFFTGIWNPKAVVDLKRKIKEFQPDIVQIQNLYPFISPAVIKMIKKQGIPLVMRCPNYRVFCPNGLHLDTKGNVCEKCLSFGRELHAISKNCENSILKSTGYAVRNFAARTIWGITKNIDAYIVQSDFQKAKFEDNGITSEKLFVVPGLTPKPILKLSSTQSSKVSFVGRASKEKGILEFLEVAKQLPNISFAVAGSIDNELDGIEKSSPSNVSWMGFLSGESFSDFYNESKIIVVPSKWYEGFPNVITRAMMMGKPVITSNIGAMSSIIDHEVNGLLVESGSISALKEAILNLYNNDEKCKEMGIKAQTKANAKYNNQGVYRALMNTYKFSLETNQ